MSKKLNYEEKLVAIRPFTKLPIKNRKNFTKTEKWYITHYFKILKSEGFIEYDREEKKFTQKGKFTRNKKGNVGEGRIRGAPRTAGRFIRGAKQSDRVTKGGKIIREHYTKEFIKTDFSDVIEQEIIDNGEVLEILFESIGKRIYKIIPSDYFTIVLENGHEIGQNQRAKTPKEKRKEGKAVGKGLTIDDKIFEVGERITELLIKARNKYKIEDLIKGIFLWHFTNQRKPTQKEVKKAKRK